MIDNKVGNGNKEKNCKEVEDNTEEQNEVKIKSSGDLKDNIKEKSLEKRFEDQWENFKDNEIDTSAFTAVI